MRLAEAQRLAGDNKGARQSYREALARDDGDYQVWLGFAFAAAGDARRDAATEALRLNPLAPEINSIRPFLGLPPLPADATTTEP